MAQKVINKKILKRILLISYIVLVVPLMVLLVLSNLNVFKAAIVRFKDLGNFLNVQTYFEIEATKSNLFYQEIINSFIENILNFIVKIHDFFSDKDQLINSIGIAGNNFLDKFCDFLIYFCNFGINAIIVLLIYFNETFNKTNLNTNKTLFAKIYLFIYNIIVKVFSAIKKSIIWVLKKLYEFRRFIALNLFLFFLANGFLFRLLIEVLIFILVYFYRTICEECYLVIFAMFKWIVIKLYPLIIAIPKWVILPTIIIFVFFVAVNKANYRLTQNHERLKKFVKNDLTQTTFINGAPGSGKTLLNVSLSLASEEMYIETLESLMLDYELKYPYYNFANLRLGKSDVGEHGEYLDYYNFLNNRKSFIISNYSIFSPYFNDYSKIFDFNFMRKNIKSEKHALEQYIVISISELDKEYNSHDDMKRVGSDGAATFFSTVSHDLKRHVKVFCDYQLKDQVPLRIRGNSEYFYNIEDKKKKYPFLLSIYYWPIRCICKFLRKLIIKYETKRPTINKKTTRRTVSEFKRNDVSLIYVILRQLSYSLNRLSDWFDHYWYFRISGTLSMNDGAKGEEKNILLNICDLSISNMALYDSTFLSYAYEQKKNAAFKDLDKFTSLTPSIDELNKCNSHFYNVLNGLEAEEPTDNREAEIDDDYIVIG